MASARLCSRFFPRFLLQVETPPRRSVGPRRPWAQALPLHGDRDNRSALSLQRAFCCNCGAGGPSCFAAPWAASLVAHPAESVPQVRLRSARTSRASMPGMRQNNTCQAIPERGLRIVPRPERPIGLLTGRLRSRLGSVSRNRARSFQGSPHGFAQSQQVHCSSLLGQHAQKKRRPPREVSVEAAVNLRFAAATLAINYGASSQSQSSSQSSSQ